VSPSRPSVQRRLSSLSHSACALHAPSWKRDAGPRRPAARQVVKKSGAAIHFKRGFPAPAQLCCGHGVVLHVCAARKNTHEAPMSDGNATLKSTCGARRWQLPSTRCRAVERCGTRRRTRTVHNQPVGRTYQKISKQYRVGWRLVKCPRHLFSTLSSGNASSGSPTVNLTRGLRQYVASSTSPCLFPWRLLEFNMAASTCSVAKWPQ